MKPTGPIPPDFAPGRLMLGGQDHADLVAAHGTPLFAYDLAVVADRIARWRGAFPGVDLHYAIKANPFAPLLAAIAPLVDGLDVASAGELTRALAVKSAAAISFAGPGKRDAELEAAIRAGATLNLESEGEADRALGLADRLGITPRLAVRVNPRYELKGSGMRMAGRPSPFGIDDDRVAPLVQRLIAAGADWRGYHLYAGSQSLDTQGIAETIAAHFDTVGRLGEETGLVAPLVNLGGGFGIPYFAGDTPVDVATIGHVVQEQIARNAPRSAGTRYALELGRWLVGECGVYLTRVVDRKESRGETFLVCDGGLHHQLAATGNFGTVVRRNYPLAMADRVGAAPEETVTVVGPLCTPLDRLGDQVGLPRVAVGDVIAVFLAGAYGATASPSAFLGHPNAAEILVGA